MFKAGLERRGMSIMQLPEPISKQVERSSSTKRCTQSITKDFC